MLNVVGVVRVAMLAGREARIENGAAKDARIHQLESDVAMLREELRIVGARMQRVPPHRRPQYTAAERMAILQLRARRGWNKSETARRFCVSDDTIRTWLRRADDDSLDQTHTPVNRFLDFVRDAVQQIKLFCPTLGKVKIADKLARAGIDWYIDWYNEYRSHDTLDGRTPNEIYFSRPPANEQPRFETRKRWSRGSPCAKPQVGIGGEPGDSIVLEIDCHKGHRHLPIVRARRVA